MTEKTREVAKIKHKIKSSFDSIGKAPQTTQNYYRYGKILGKGAFGKVNLGIHRLARGLVAIKSVNVKLLKDEQKEKIYEEMAILKKTRHINICRLYDTFETDDHVMFVMELCSGGDLLNYVRKRRKLTDEQSRYIFSQILGGLYHCHAQGIIHRDIKLDNILLDDQGVVKIGDFGVSKFVQPYEVMKEQCGTPAYIAPEILIDDGYKGYGADVWSSGVVLYAMLYGVVPFKSQDQYELHKMIITGNYEIKESIGVLANDLIRKILQPDPNK